MDEYTTKRRGRPVGYELSNSTKDKIRKSRLGKSHSTETRNKISQSLIKYFRKRDPVSQGIKREYRYFSTEVLDWISAHKDDLDNTDDIMDNKRIVYLSQLEVCYGSEIENFCHNTTPEFLLLLKEELLNIDTDYDFNELLSLV